jgi:predicted small lipoprotein YifL
VTRWLAALALASLAACAQQSPAGLPPAIQVWNRGDTPVTIGLSDAAGQQCAQTQITPNTVTTLKLCGVADSLMIELPTELKSYPVQAGATYVARTEYTFWFLQDATGHRL